MKDKNPKKPRVVRQKLSTYERVIKKKFIIGKRKAPLIRILIGFVIGVLFASFFSVDLKDAILYYFNLFIYSIEN